MKKVSNRISFIDNIVVTEAKIQKKLILHSFFSVFFRSPGKIM